MATHNTATVHVVSHDDALLDSLPAGEWLAKSNLNRLGLPDELAGNELAENRFLLTDKLVEGDADFVGFASARWDERFPEWPGLADIKDAIDLLPRDGRTYFGPQTIVASGPQVAAWAKAQDAVHPGMAPLSTELLDAMGRNNLSDTRLRPITMGNNFVLPRPVAEEFLAYWQAAFTYLHEKYGFDLPFGYRCPKCGLVDDAGVGRWSRSRHAGFFYERVSALFFATSPELRAVKPVAGELVPVRRNHLAFLFGVGPTGYRALETAKRIGKPCTHVYDALGK
jgi:hypothetical protein